MNKQFYRTKFNAKLGTYVAVSELAKSHQGDTSPRIKASIDTETTDSSIATTGQRTLKQLVLALSGLMAFSPIYANVVVNNNAAAAHKATVLKEGNAANVWITAPSASGVSRNSYTQFDVNQNGVILNNSRGAATSQITKTSLAANPNLAKGAATTIVNEVVSTNPSLLQGNLEVLGSRANVVIANPTGITVNGGGFINANQVTLSTGVLGYNTDGSIKNHTVKQGIITINPDANNRGLGGNANNPVALELLGRSIAINAPVNATTITAVTGANIVAADTGEFTATTGAGTKPTVAIDVAQLGGLYANSIYLYANEAGVGVNNAGVIQAQNNVVLNSNGKIEHKGTISSTSKTQSLVSISTRGTGAAGDINSSGSINGYGVLTIDAGNNINVNAKDITLNYEGIASSPLILSAKGNLNLAAGTKVANLGTLGDLYIDAENIILGADTELRSNRGSAVIQANNSLVSNKAGFVAAKDLTLSGNENLKLTDTRLHASSGDIYLQSTSKDKVSNNINVQGGTVYAAKGLTVYSDKDATINNLNFLKKTNSTQAQVNSINAYAGNNLKFSTTNQEFPYTSGKIQLGAGNQLTLEGKDQDSKLSGGGGLKLSGKNITTKNIYMTGSGANGVDIVSDGGDILLDQGSRIWGNTGDININALNGNITANSLKATTGGKIAILANKNVELNSLQKLATSVAGNNTLITDKGVIGGQKGVTIGSIGEGNVKINATNLTAQQGEIQLTSQNGLTLDKNVDVILKNNTLSDSNVSSILNGQAISIDNNKSNIQIADTQLTATTGKLLVSNKVGMTTIKDSVLTSKGNTELHAKDLLTLQGVTANSDQHLAVNSGRTVYINAEYTPATVWIPNKVTNLTSKGVTSVTATGNQVLQNANITGGAVLMEAGGFILGQTGMNYNATGSDLLKNDTKLNSLNGDLSIQTGRDLTIDPTKHKLSAVGDIDLVSKNGALILNGYGGTTGNGSEKVVSLNTANGGINLQGNKVELQGSKLIANKDINVVATAGNIVIDGIKNKIVASKSYSKVSDLNTLKFINDMQWNSVNNILNNDSESNSIYKATIGEANLRSFKSYLENEGAQLNNDLNFFSSTLNGYEHVGANLQSSGNINIASKEGILVRGASLSGSERILLEAKGTLDKTLTAKDTQDQINAGILIDGIVDSYEQGNENDANYSVKEFFKGPYFSAGQGGIDIKVTGGQATDNLVIQGAKINSSGTVNLESTHDLILLAGQDQSYDKWTNVTKKRSWYGKKKTITTINQQVNTSSIPVEIDAQNINLKSLGDTILYSTEMAARAGGNLDIKASNLKLLVTDELNKRETTTRKKSSFWGLKYNDTKTNNSYKELTQVPVKAKADYINARADYDMLIQGAEFNYLKGASIQAGGKITLVPATTLVETSSTKSSNSVVWQSMQDKGSITETAKLPSFNGPVAPKFIGSLTVQVPVAKRTASQNELIGEIEKLAKQPGNEYLKSLIDNKDQKVNWEQVLLTNEKWDYKSQGLTGAGAALIVLIVTIVTMGSGTAAAAGAAGGTAAGGTTVGLGASMIGTAGVTTTAAGAIIPSTLGVMANAAVTSMLTQASISAINNGGDLGKTLKDLGSSDSIKNLATSVLTAGALSQLADTKIMSDLNKYTKTGSFITDLTARTTQGIINAGATTLVSSAVNGGSLSDKLSLALLFNTADSLQGALSVQIKGLENVDYLLHKIAHAAAGCAAAVVAKANCESGAIGAAVGEIVAEEMDRSFDKQDFKNDQDILDYQQKVRAASKLIAGTIAGLTGYDVNTAANTAEIAVVNNRQLNQAEVKRIELLAEGNANQQARLSIAACAMVKCAEGYEGTTEYSYLKAIQDAGSSEKFKTERDLLAKQNFRVVTGGFVNKDAQLFDYTLLDRTTDYLNSIYNPLDRDYQITNRATGILMVAGGATGITGSTALGSTCITGAGCVLALGGFVSSADLTMAGLNQTLYGKPTNTLGAQVISSTTGLSLNQSELVYGMLGLASVTNAVRSGAKEALTEGRVLINKPVASCANGTTCFVAGTLIETDQGLKPIESFIGGELIWSRSDKDFLYDYQPVVATKVTHNQPIYELVVENDLGVKETFNTTEEHPFWVKDIGWQKASILKQDDILLDRNGKDLKVVSQVLLAKLDTVYNIEVDHYHTYHVGKLGVWVHNDKCCDLVYQNIAKETKYGVISNRKLDQNAIELDLTSTTSNQAKQIAQTGDPLGVKTEALFENVVREQGGKVLSGGKYGSNNGYDHVIVFKDAQGNVNLTMVVDSKQLGQKGVRLDPNAAGGKMQMSSEWDDVVLGRLDKKSEAYKVVDAARDNGKLVKGVAYVDKNTGKLMLVRVEPVTKK